MDNNEFTLEVSQAAVAEMVRNVLLYRDRHGDQYGQQCNEYTLEEPDGVDNEEGIFRERQLFFTEDVNVDSGREEAL